MRDDQSKAGQAYQAAKTAKRVKQVASTGRAAVFFFNPATLVVGVVVFVVLLLVIIVGIAVAGMAGSASGGQSGGGGQTQGGGGEVSEAGQALRNAFLAQQNITYQKDVIKDEIRDGGVAENVLRAVLAAARVDGIGTLAISAAGCRSHSNTGGLHCPTTPAQALDIGSVGTSNPKLVNKKICQDFKNGDPYKINELGGITSSAECIINGGKLNQPQFDSTDHIHVGTY